MHHRIRVNALMKALLRHSRCCGTAVAVLMHARPATCSCCCIHHQCNTLIPRTQELQQTVCPTPPAPSSASTAPQAAAAAAQHARRGTHGMMPCTGTSNGGAQAMRSGLRDVRWRPPRHCSSNTPSPPAYPRMCPKKASAVLGWAGARRHRRACAKQPMPCTLQRMMQRSAACMWRPRTLRRVPWGLQLAMPALFA